ncbi:MAG: hypothetical protein LUO93_05935 [Methanomicrobiales archaeon]|nr:hypothetical protein [Methanomicrobiales archaeon]
MSYVDSIMTGTDAEIMPLLVEFYGGGDPILDCTFGMGRFWAHEKPKNLVTLDITTRADIVGTYDRLPFKDQVIGTIVFDPPHMRVSSGRVYLMYQPPTKAPDFTLFLGEAKRILRIGGVVIAKMADELMVRPWNHVKFITGAEEVGLEPFDLIVRSRHLSIRNTAHPQYRARRKHCFYVILKKKK